tara:strand:+ start:471 stop:599 length:129 start_codon:yes stop_codon:yes gene_type:complete
MLPHGLIDPESVSVSREERWNEIVEKVRRRKGKEVWSLVNQM